MLAGTGLGLHSLTLFGAINFTVNVRLVCQKLDRHKHSSLFHFGTVYKGATFYRIGFKAAELNFQSRSNPLVNGRPRGSSRELLKGTDFGKC